MYVEIENLKVYDPVEVPTPVRVGDPVLLLEDVQTLPPVTPGLVSVKPPVAVDYVQTQPVQALDVVKVLPVVTLEAGTNYYYQLTEHPIWKGLWH